jgi:glutaredoxin
MSRRRRSSIALAVSLAVVACGGESDPAAATNAAAGGDRAGEVVTPPFEVRGDADGLLLTWFDETGSHTATTRHEIPEARRGEVRVDSLELGPEQRDPENVFVADLRAPREDGRYEVRRMPREHFDRRVETFGDAPAEGVAAGGGTGPGAIAASDVVIFGASWCGACREAEAYLRSRGIPFTHRDVERDPGAREDMQRRAAAVGLRPTGIPVIDIRGRVMQGFDREAIDRALRETGGGGTGSGLSI